MKFTIINKASLSHTSNVSEFDTDNIISIEPIYNKVISNSMDIKTTTKK